MADLKSHKTFVNNKFEILTDEGFKDFIGIIVGKNKEKIELCLSNNKKLRCTPKHKICITKDSYIFAKNLKIGDVLYGGVSILDIKKSFNDDLMYEILEVSDIHRYYANGCLSAQCLLLDELAWITPDSIVEDFMKSVLPTVSRNKTGRIMITSTPRGKANVFYRMFNAATKKGTSEWNGFNAETVHWSEIPERDETWKREQIALLGSHEAFSQEFDCEFLDDGTSAIDAELFDQLKKQCFEPKHLLDEGHYKIWEDPDASRLYVAGVDVAEGVGGDASVIQILDITDLRDIQQVAEYHNNQIAPAEFSNKLHEILLNWGSPLVLIERNNQGGQVCDRLAIDFGYEKVVSWGAKKANRMNAQYGVISHTNTKHSAILNQRYFINEMRNVKFRSINTLNEFKTFVRYPNGTWKAKGGEHDDRVMAFVWALMILFNEITEIYFEIDELDDYGKPLKISPYDHGIKYFENATSIYTNEQVNKIEHSNLSPMAFGAFGESDNEMAGLLADGWKSLNGGMPHVDPSRSMSQESYDAMNRWFT